MDSTHCLENLLRLEDISLRQRERDTTR